MSKEMIVELLKSKAFVAVVVAGAGFLLSQFTEVPVEDISVVITGIFGIIIVLLQKDDIDNKATIQHQAALLEK